MKETLDPVLSYVLITKTDQTVLCWERERERELESEGERENPVYVNLMSNCINIIRNNISHGLSAPYLLKE